MVCFHFPMTNHEELHSSLKQTQMPKIWSPHTVIHHFQYWSRQSDVKKCFKETRQFEDRCFHWYSSSSAVFLNLSQINLCAYGQRFPFRNLFFCGQVVNANKSFLKWLFSTNSFVLEVKKEKGLHVKDKERHWLTLINKDHLAWRWCQELS